MKFSIKLRISKLDFGQCDWLKDTATAPKSLLVWTEWSRTAFKEIPISHPPEASVPVIEEQDVDFELEVDSKTLEMRHGELGIMVALLGDYRRLKEPGVMMAGRTVFHDGSSTHLFTSKRVKLFSLADVYTGDTGIEGQEPSQFEAILSQKNRVPTVTVMLSGLSEHTKSSSSSAAANYVNGMNSLDAGFIRMSHGDLLGQWDAETNSAIEVSGCSKFISDILPRIKWAHQYVGHVLVGPVEQSMMNDMTSIPFSAEYLESLLAISAVLVFDCEGKPPFQPPEIRAMIKESFEGQGQVQSRVIKKDMGENVAMLIHWIVTACDLFSKLCPYRQDKRIDPNTGNEIMVEDVNSLDWGIGDCEEDSLSVASTMLAIIQKRAINRQGDFQLLDLAEGLCSGWQCGMALVTFPDSGHEVAHSTCIFTTTFVESDGGTPTGFYCADGVEHGLPIWKAIEPARFEKVYTFKTGSPTFVRGPGAGERPFSTRESLITGPTAALSSNRDDMFAGMKLLRWFTPDGVLVPFNKKAGTLGCFVNEDIRGVEFVKVAERHDPSEFNSQCKLPIKIHDKQNGGLDPRIETLHAPQIPGISVMTFDNNRDTEVSHISESERVAYGVYKIHITQDAFAKVIVNRL